MGIRGFPVILGVLLGIYRFWGLSHVCIFFGGSIRLSGTTDGSEKISVFCFVLKASGINDLKRVRGLLGGVQPRHVVKFLLDSSKAQQR